MALALGQLAVQVPELGPVRRRHGDGRSSELECLCQALISRAGWGAIIACMEDEDKPKSFEEMLGAIADEVTRSIQRIWPSSTAGPGAREHAVDAERARSFMDNAGEWLRAQAETMRDVADAPCPRPTPPRFE